MSVLFFTIYDKLTNKDLATLPLTIPIGETLQGFENAGYQVGWKWEKASE